MRLLSLMILSMALLGITPRTGRHVRTERAPRRRVRPYVLDAGHRARRTEEPRHAVDDQRQGSATLMELGAPAVSAPVDDMAELRDAVRRYLTHRPDPMWHCRVPGCRMSAPYPVTHPCPLTGTRTPELAVAS